MSVLKYSGRVVRKPGSDAASARRSARMRRHLRLRKKLSGTSERPRLVVTRSSRHIVAQIVDDATGRVLASASSMDQSVRALAGDKTERARAVGKLVAERAAAQDITRVVFDRGGNQYHGRIAALADSAREGGLEL